MGWPRQASKFATTSQYLVVQLEWRSATKTSPDSNSASYHMAKSHPALPNQHTYWQNLASQAQSYFQTSPWSGVGVSEGIKDRKHPPSTIQTEAETSPLHKYTTFRNKEDPCRGERLLLKQA